MNRPDDISYTASHEWTRLKGKTLTLGVTDFAVEHLGDIVFVDLPEPGKTIAKGDTVCEIESVKAVGEVYSPATGKVAEVNSGLADDSAPLAKDPFGEGWLLRIEIQDPGELEGLMDRAAYEAHLEEAQGD